MWLCPAGMLGIDGICWDMLGMGIAQLPADASIIELDDGKSLTGNPEIFDGQKPMGFRLRFCLKPIH